MFECLQITNLNFLPERIIDEWINWLFPCLIDQYDGKKCIEPLNTHEKSCILFSVYWRLNEDPMKRSVLSGSNVNFLISILRLRFLLCICECYEIFTWQLCQLLIMIYSVYRYQRVSPDCLPLSNGRKSSGENGKSITNGLNSTTASFETKGFRFRSPSRSQDLHSPPHSDNNHNLQTQKQETSSPSPSRGGSGDVLLQWGQKKRARVSRSEIRALADESSSSGQSRQSKVPRRLESNKLSAPAMPPPPPPPQGVNFRKENPFLPHRNLERRSGAVNGSPSRNSGGSSRVVSRSATGKRSPPTPDKVDRKMLGSSRSAKDERPNGSTAQPDHLNYAGPAPTTTPPQSEQETGVTNTAAVAEKVHPELIEWPRIYVALTRKEKEDDFFAMKGTKLPQRPKKRAKNIDKTLQYCFPGMWLSDLTKSRYEVREKKSVKKQKRRGLKGMESMESDSE